jgi:hypothetical protein
MLLQPLALRDSTIHEISCNFLGSTGVGTQSLALARKVLYHVSPSTSLAVIFYAANGIFPSILLGSALLQRTLEEPKVLREQLKNKVSPKHHQALNFSNTGSAA